MPHVPEASLRPAEQRAQPASKGSQAAVPLLSIASTDPVMPALSKGSSRPRPRAAAQPQDRRGERAEQTSIKGAGTGAAAAPRTRSRPKEKVLDGDMAKAAAVVDGLVFPKTAKWRRRAPRIVVNKKDSEDKFIKSKAYVSSLPAEDLRENRHKTCAVVGNGGAMLSKPWGSSIDRHDAVFRFNDGPTEGFERHVGSKTTYRLTNNKWTHFYSKKHPRGASEENIVLFGHGSAGLGAHLVHEFPGESVLLLAPEFASQARGQYKQGQAALSSMGVVEVHGRNSAPTGIEGIFMALALCQRVHLYGFGVERDPSVPYHYHDKVRGVEAAHSFGFQALLLKLLKFRDIFALCVPGHDTEECLSPELSDPSAYDRAVKSMESAGGGAARGSSLRGRGTTPAADDEPDGAGSRDRCSPPSGCLSPLGWLPSVLRGSPQVHRSLQTASVPVPTEIPPLLLCQEPSAPALGRHR
eukprot:CAMPEP_0177599494 /NCGR_PEP_ID=MMETSP0419_2-20121207/13028_1 /TAXON_ID=582737 /ORGANISM="Tetraselmis sp., Strain GSL018" /LENGTH=467 /DNA_ID=CAMNT_0019092241 /DNA_START=541 /DNA_END=1945 /DNA_ORIENTATION=-